jgi:hypothetical protein
MIQLNIKQDFTDFSIKFHAQIIWFIFLLILFICGIFNEDFNI